MSEYEPHNWAILKSPKKHEGEDVYKVFGEWRGGYLDGDSWRLNSGISGIYLERNPGHFVYSIEGYSGSRYRCNPESEGIRGLYCQSVLDQIIDKGFKVVNIADLPKELYK